MQRAEQICQTDQTSFHGQAESEHLSSSTSWVLQEISWPQSGPGCICKRYLLVVAASKAIAILQQMEGDGYCSIEADSVYGAAVAMPQIARSAGWPATLTSLVIRIYFFTLPRSRDLRGSWWS
eukprot:s169_g16.t1